MTTLATLDFEAGSDGSPLLNVGGWTSFTGTGEYDTEQANSGSVSGLFGAAWGQYMYDFGDGTPAAQFRLRMYLRRGFTEMVSHPFIAQISDNADAYVCDFQVRNELGGPFRQRWGYNAYFAQAASAWPNDEWTRVDLLYKGPDVADGWTAIVYTTADDSVEDYRLEVPTFATGIRYLRVGNPSNAGHLFWMDDVLLQDTLDDPGPVGGAPPSNPPLIISSSSVLYKGATAIDKLYRGATLLWSKSITSGFVDGLASFLTSWPGVHTAFSFNNTDVNSGTDSAMVAKFASYGSADTTVYANAGLNAQCSPTPNYQLDTLTVTDAAMLVYIPPTLPTLSYTLFHNGGSTNGQTGLIRSDNNGETITVGISHNTGGSNQDYTTFVLEQRGWVMLGFQFDDTTNKMAIWVNGVKASEVSRTFELAYGSGDPRIGGGSARAIPGWANNHIGGSGLLIANFVADNPNHTNSTPDGCGNAFYTDYYSAMTP